MVNGLYRCIVRDCGGEEDVQKASRIDRPVRRRMHTLRQGGEACGPFDDVRGREDHGACRQGKEGVEVRQDERRTWPVTCVRHQKRDVVEKSS